MWEDDPVWKLDPVLEPFKKLPVTGRLVGYAGKPNQKAAEVVTKYIIVDMYAKAIQGMDAAESVKAAHAELASIYGA
jgi:multiple sugar transport system substrate-binding protein